MDLYCNSYRFYKEIGEQRLIFEEAAAPDKLACYPEDAEKEPDSPEALLQQAYEEEDEFLESMRPKAAIEDIMKKVDVDIPLGIQRLIGDKNFLTEKWKVLMVKDLMRVSMLMNAKLRYFPDPEADVTERRQYHDLLIYPARVHALGWDMQGYWSGLSDMADSVLPGPDGLFSNVVTFFREGVYDQAADTVMNDEGVTDSEAITFFRIQKKIAQAQLAILQAKPQTERRQGKIDNLRIIIDLYDKTIQGAEDMRDIIRRGLKAAEAESKRADEAGATQLLEATPK